MYCCAVVRFDLQTVTPVVQDASDAKANLVGEQPEDISGCKTATLRRMRWDYLLHTNHLISSATTTRTRKLSYTGLTLHRSVAAGIVYSLIVPSAMCLGVEPYICYGVSWGLASASEPRARRGVPHYNMFFPFVVSCFVAIFPLLMLSLKLSLIHI